MVIVWTLDLPRPLILPRLSLSHHKRFLRAYETRAFLLFKLIFSAFVTHSGLDRACHKGLSFLRFTNIEVHQTLRELPHPSASEDHAVSESSDKLFHFNHFVTSLNLVWFGYWLGLTSLLLDGTLTESLVKSSHFMSAKPVFRLVTLAGSFTL